MPRKSRKNVGLIGLGIIGSRVAACLRKAGFHCYVWNRSPRAEPNFLGSAAEVAEVCQILQIFVPDAQALFETIDAVADRLTPSHTVLCNATVGPEATVEAARLVQMCGAKFLDAPFTGSKGAAEKGQLVYFIGGADDVLRQVEPILQASSKAIVKIGDIGSAATVKIATNMLGATIVQTLAEAIALLKTSGIDPEVLTAAVEHHGVRSPLMDLKLPAMLKGDFTTNFSVKHMFKDVQIGIHIANSTELDLPATTASAGILYGAMDSGWGDLDYSAVVKTYDTVTRAPLALREERNKALPAPEPAPSALVETTPVPLPAPSAESKLESKAPGDDAPKPSETDKPAEVNPEPEKPVDLDKPSDASNPSDPADPAKPESDPAKPDPENPEPKKGFGWLFSKK